MTTIIRILICVLISVLLLGNTRLNASGVETPLRDGWKLQSSCKITGDGPAISSPQFDTTGWYTTSVPSTVLAAQVAAGEFPDLFMGMNLRKVPGTTYPIGLNSFAHLPMDKSSPYACPWWYRKTFAFRASPEHPTVWLHFKGINNRANIWLNGTKVAGSDEVAGAYRIYEFDVTRLIKPGANVLAVETIAPTEKDLGINWVDWNPTPPDKNMGLWGEVFLSTSGPVSVRYPAAMTHFRDGSLKEASLTVVAEVNNASEKPIRGTAEAIIDNIRVQQTVELQAGESRSVTFEPAHFPELTIKNPTVWWPAPLGPQTLHDLTVRFMVEKAISDSAHARIGIREITSELTDKGHRLFRVNGRKILIRGGGWAQDMLLRHSSEKLNAQLEYVKAMGLNTVRLEAQLESDEFFQLADEKGILVMAGWCCCDIWEEWNKWVPGTLQVATASLRSQMLRLRSHPSLLVWLNGSDGPPPPEVELAYLDVEKKTAWPNPVLSSASADPTKPTGPSGVKMTGPYDYVPPIYWLTDKQYGGAYGFNTETSPGPAPPEPATLRRMIPKEHLWPIDEVWNYHAGGERFQNVNVFNEAMKATYGEPKSFEDYSLKAQAMTYDGERAMFEAYARNKYTSTGVIQWMLNNAWPSLIWHLYDYYLLPAGGFYGTKKACEPLHIQYSYDDRSVIAVNSLSKPFPGMTSTVKLFDKDLKPLYSQNVALDLEPDGVRPVLTLPPLPEEPSPTVYFLKLSLHDANGKEVSSNFYWLPSKHATMAWDKTPDTAYTPIATHEDMTALNSLPPVRLRLTVSQLQQADHDAVRVIIRNPSQTLAFQIHLALTPTDSEADYVPVFWEDNYISLVPGESRTVTARYLTRGVLQKRSVLRVDGWNITPMQIPITVVSKAFAQAKR